MWTQGSWRTVAARHVVILVFKGRMYLWSSSILCGTSNVLRAEKSERKKKKEPPPSKPRPPPSSSAPPPARISPARPAARWSRLTIRPLNRDIFWSLEFYLFFCWSITYLTFVELELFAPLQWLFDSVFLETDVSMATVRMWLLSLLFFSWWIEFHFSIGISIGFSLSFF